jgi:hypothetical protein
MAPFHSDQDNRRIRRLRGNGDGTATPAAILEDSFDLKHAQLGDHNGSLPLPNATATAEYGNAWPETHDQHHFTTYLFLGFVVLLCLGFVVLVAGSCVLRRRQAREDDAALRRRYRARLFADAAARSARREGEARRRALVETALVTTKAALLPRRAAPFGRGDAAKSGESTGHSTDAESTSSSSSAGEASSDDETADGDGRGGEDLNAAEQGQPAAPSRSSAPEVSSPADAAPSAVRAPATPAAAFDWRAETCAICLEPYAEHDDVSYARHQQCAHVFHAACILQWLEDAGRDDCPCCREPYLRAAEDGGGGAA